jgi:rare lipoprotein A (peptidoglycan hydrolase)
MKCISHVSQGPAMQLHSLFVTLSIACLAAGCANAPDAPFTHLSINVPEIERPPAPIAEAIWDGRITKPAPVALAPAESAAAKPSPMTTASLASQAPPAAAPSKAAKSAAFPSLTGKGHAMTGVASYYWQEQMTSSGEKFDKRAMTAAHRTLPLGTRVRVTHTATGRSVVVRINDRGPFKPGRVIDLSEAAAEQLQMTSAGLASVKIEVVR